MIVPVSCSTRSHVLPLPTVLGVASLYYVDVIDEYVPRLDAEMLEQFRSFVEAEAQAHGTVLLKQAHLPLKQVHLTEHGVEHVVSSAVATLHSLIMILTIACRHH